MKKVNGDGQVLTLSFSRPVRIAVAPRGAVPLERGGFEPRFAAELPEGAHANGPFHVFRAGLSRLSCVADFRIATAF